MTAIPVDVVERAVTTAEGSPWRLCVAPMMDWTDRHCRWFHRQLSRHARLYTEMVHAHAVLRGDRGRLLGFDPIEHPVALQLGGSDPGLLAQAARIGADWGYDEINLNVGCPSERVQSGSFGACLMREPVLVADCVAAMRAAVPATIPVTVKCRIGVDDQDDDADLFRFVHTVATAGCATFIVHARKAWLKGLSPKENREIPPLNWPRVQRLKREFARLSIVINGGITTLDAAIEAGAGLDGVMIGRAAYHDPWLLACIERAWFGAEGAADTREQVMDELTGYARGFTARGERVAHLARHIVGLYQGEPGARAFRRVLSTESTRPGADWRVLEAARAAMASTHRPAA
jgi:tRNA-dihydrouridine synthase A